MKHFLVLQNIWILTAAALAVAVYVIACFALMEFLVLRAIGLSPRGMPKIIRHPFDRIMIAQAKADSLVFLTHDARIAEYDESRVLWV